MSVFEAALEVAVFLDDQKIPYAVLGGVALQHWGEPRTTQDVDIVVMVPWESEEDFLRKVLQRFRPRIAEALAFAKQHRVLLISTSDGIPVDPSLGIPGYEEEAMRRATKVSLAGLAPIRVVSAEDLIIHKCIAGRARDVEDVERVLVRQKVKLNLPYIRRWLRAFAPVIEGHDVRALFENLVRKARRTLHGESRR